MLPKITSIGNINGDLKIFLIITFDLDISNCNGVEL